MQNLTNLQGVQKRKYMAIDKSSFLKTIKENVSGAKETVKNYASASRLKSNRRKMIENVARQNIKNKGFDRAGGVAAQEAFNKEQRGLKKEMKQKGVY